MKRLFLDFESVDINDAMTFVNLRLTSESGCSSSRDADTRHFLLSIALIHSLREEVIITLSHVFTNKLDNMSYLLLFGCSNETILIIFVLLNGLDVEPVLWEIRR